MERDGSRAPGRAVPIYLERNSQTCYLPPLPPTAIFTPTSSLAPQGVANKINPFPPLVEPDSVQPPPAVGRSDARHLAGVYDTPNPVMQARCRQLPLSALSSEHLKVELARRKIRDSGSCTRGDGVAVEQKGR